MNGENNKAMLKKLSKEEQAPWKAKYTSTSRTLTRGCWFFDFLHAIFNGFVEKRDDKLSKVASEAYTKALAPHHPWMLRKVAGVAMNAITYRASFI